MSREKAKKFSPEVRSRAVRMVVVLGNLILRCGGEGSTAFGMSLESGSEVTRLTSSADKGLLRGFTGPDRWPSAGPRRGPGQMADEICRYAAQRS